MPRSLRTRLIFSFLVIIIVTTGLFVLLTNLIITQRFNSMVIRDGQRYSMRISPLFAEYYAQTGGWEGIEELVDSFQNQRPMLGPFGHKPHIDGVGMEWMAAATEERLLLLDVDGQLVFDSAPSDSAIQELPEDTEKGIPIVVENEQVGTLIVASTLGILTTVQSDFIHQVNIVMLVAALIAVLAVLVVGTWQARKIIAPVQALAEASRRVADGDLSQKIPVTSQDELGEMAVAFNTMAAELTQQQELRLRAMADIAHELRTPLTVLQIDLESIEDGLTIPNAETITRLKSEVFHLNNLVEDLRILSRVDAGDLTIDFQPLEIVALVRVVINRVRETARENEIDLVAHLPEMELWVIGDDQRLAQVLLNLLSNAFQHTPPNGQVTVTVKREGDEVHLSVQDTGEGIPAGDIPHIFKRLYRADLARSRDKGNSGLGLSIARSLVEAHSGRIWVDSIEGEGSIFTISLPLNLGTTQSV